MKWRKKQFDKTSWPYRKADDVCVVLKWSQNIPVRGAEVFFWSFLYNHINFINHLIIYQHSCSALQQFHHLRPLTPRWASTVSANIHDTTSLHARSLRYTSRSEKRKRNRERSELTGVRKRRGKERRGEERQAASVQRGSAGGAAVLMSWHLCWVKWLVNRFSAPPLLCWWGARCAAEATYQMC